MGFQLHKYSTCSLVQLFNEDVQSGDGFITQLDDKKHIFINDKIHYIG